MIAEKTIVETDVLIIGGGIAGLMAQLKASPFLSACIFMGSATRPTSSTRSKGRTSRMSSGMMTTCAPAPTWASAGFIIVEASMAPSAAPAPTSV